MKCYLFYILFIYLVPIKTQEIEELKEVRIGRNESKFLNDGLSVEFYEYRYKHNHKPVFDLVKLMKQPKLSGIADENWPYPEDEDPFSKYKRNGCKKCQCGVQSKKRIVNGSFAKRDEFPWQVLITYKMKFSCGGSLLNDLYVLTAAHCAFGINKNDLKVRFGVFKIHTKPAIYRQIDRIWIANNYNLTSTTLVHDIAIVKLKSNVRITPSVRPICLPIPGSTYDGALATVTGWGKLYFNGPSAEVLKKSQLPVLTNKQCQRTDYGNSIKPSQLCAGANGRTPCNGDSGGPLVTFQSERYRQIGIVSFGVGCTTFDIPAVFTRVTSYYQTIIKIASKGGACWCNDSVK